MQLINLYIKEVTRRIPEKMREDITLELKSTILDMLPEDFTDDDVYKALDELGNPAVLASGYRDRPLHLIGPKFYDLYISLLKLVLGIAGTVVLITFVINEILTFSGDGAIVAFIVGIIVGAIGVLIETGIHSFVWVTIIFIILERTIEPTVNVPLSLSGKKWTAIDLKNKSYIPVKREIPPLEPGFNLFWSAVWVTLYFNAAHIIGVYQSNAANELIFTMPIFNQHVLLSFLIVLMIYFLLEVTKAIYMLIVRQWTQRLAIFNTINHIVGFIILSVIIFHPDLLNEAFIPYMADQIGNSTQDVAKGIYWIKRLIVGIIVITGGIDIYQGFKKANLK